MGMAVRVEISVRLEWCQLVAQVDVKLAGIAQWSYIMGNIVLIIQAIKGLITGRLETSGENSIGLDLCKVLLFGI